MNLIIALSPTSGSSAHRLEDQLGHRVILDGQSAASVASQEDKKTDDEKPVDHRCEARISGDSSLSVRGLPGLDPAAEPSAFVYPGGGATNPTGPNPEELLKVLGLRTVLKFQKCGCAGYIAKCTNRGLPDRDAKVAGNLDRSGAAD